MEQRIAEVFRLKLPQHHDFTPVQAAPFEQYSH
jgi:hypothetical protein